MAQITALCLSMIIEAFVASGIYYIARRRLSIRIGLIAIGATLLSHPFAWKVIYGVASTLGFC